ncbi:MAG: hypothetical protein LBH46_03440, partial [Rickettsiales bacterium]|nr:hypothetical protein [Rickettsiales bacterium]
MSQERLGVISENNKFDSFIFYSILYRMVDKDSQKVKNVDVEDVGSEDDDNGFTNSGDFKKKLVKYVFLFCVAVVVVFFAFLLVFKVKVKPIEYVDKLNKNFAELLRETDSVIVIDDNAPSFKIFPYPHFEVNKVKITNLVKDKNTFNGEIGQVNIFLKLEKIFFLKTEIENFTFDKPDLYIKPFLEKKIRESDTDIVGDDLVANTSIEEPNEPIDLGDTTETIEEPATIEKTEETKEKKTEYGNTDFLKMFFDKKINIRDGKITVDYSKYSRKI